MLVLRDRLCRGGSGIGIVSVSSVHYCMVRWCLFFYGCFGFGLYGRPYVLEVLGVKNCASGWIWGQGGKSGIEVGDWRLEIGRSARGW